MNETTTADELREPEPSRPASTPTTLGGSIIYRLCEELIGMREESRRQHKLFEQALAKQRESLQATFNSFAADTQRAYQLLRQELTGEKRLALALMNELMDVAADCERIMAARPSTGLAADLEKWADGVAVESRKLQEALRRHGIHPYDAILGSAYDPAMHERTGSKRMEGMDPLRVAEQVERGYASQTPEFILRRPKVLVSE